MKKAFRKRHDFAPKNPERYLIFLKEHFTKTTPTFYSVASKKRIDTPDGAMYAVDLVEDIENPAYESIAECFINGEAVYLWNDHCWGVAVDKDGKEISHSVVRIPGSAFDSKSKFSNKRTALLFQIGHDPVE